MTFVQKTVSWLALCITMLVGSGAPLAMHMARDHFAPAADDVPRHVHADEHLAESHMPVRAPADQSGAAGSQNQSHDCPVCQVIAVRGVAIYQPAPATHLAADPARLAIPSDQILSRDVSLISAARAPPSAHA